MLNKSLKDMFLNTCLSTIYSGVKMSEDMIGKAFVKEVLAVPVEGGGDVFVYEVENRSDDLLFDDFYIATFDDTSNEIVWGVGYSIKDTLEDAKRNWDREEGDEYPNPFREALEAMEKIEPEDLVGEVTVKEVLNVPVKDGSVFVYKIENDNDNLLFQDFYIATFDNLSTEVIWGAGTTPLDAIKDAERVWDREPDDEYPNPFREALEKFKEEERRELLQNY